MAEGQRVLGSAEDDSAEGGSLQIFSRVAGQQILPVLEAVSQDLEGQRLSQNASRLVVP